MDQQSLDQFTHLYSVQKTLRFELKPIGKTQDWIEKKGLLEQDDHRAQSYKLAKKLIDFYHKGFIDNSLRSLITNNEAKSQFVELLDSYRLLIGKTDTTLKKKMEKIQESLRRSITKLFDIKRLSGKELIKEDIMAYLYDCHQHGVVLPCEMTIDECKSIIAEFENFTTYFVGFNENRRNMYSDEAKSTAIAYRLIHENLPKYINNMDVWSRVSIVLKEQIAQLEHNMQTVLNGKSLNIFFDSLSSYTECLTQADITRYNTLIGGLSENNVKIQGLNEYINLYNQTVDRRERLPKMTELYKMILSDHDTLSWIPQQFSNDNEILETIEKAYKEISTTIFEDNEDQPSLKSLLANLRDYNTEGIYIKTDTSLTSVIKQAYGEWDAMDKGLKEAYNAAHPLKDKRKTEKHEEDCKKWVKSFDSHSLADICHYTQSDAVLKWYESLWVKDDVTAFERVESAYVAAQDLLNTEYHGNLKTDDKSIEKIKTLLDALKDLQRLAATLKGQGDESGRDGLFYAEWERHITTLDTITPLYNMVRNYVTQKAYSEEKFKLNFNNPQLLGGWDQNKETDCLGILLRKNSLYYLGIMDKNCRKSFAGELPVEGDCYEKVDYKFFKDLTTMVPKCTTQLNAVKEHFAISNCDYILSNTNYVKDLVISKEIFELNNITYDGKKKFQSDYLRNTRDKLGYEHAVTKWIEFCYDFLAAYKSTSIYDTSSIKRMEFSRIDDFYSKMNKCLYKLSFRPVSVSYIDKLVDEGSLYLFQIYNKDFSPYSKGTPNMHTLYWRALFSDENLKDVVYKLNGQAEVFYRRKSITYDEKHQQEGYHYEQLKDKFNYPIHKDRRYSVDKFQFHVPITMNFKSTGHDNIEQQVREFIKIGGVKHIIGIDRGERHLLYLSMIDLKGRIIKQFSLNVVKNEYKETDYHNLLDNREADRDKARKNWQTIEGIKDLKEGYLSQVVHIISQLMIKYQAIVVLEDLNFGFMRGRQKVEKQVYQKFEKMLIDKLNYLVDKKKTLTETGGVLRALQLTSKFDSFQKLGKQSGFLFYVPASLTSKIDPVTGFVNYINTRYENRDKARELLGKFADIRYNANRDYFEFVINEYKKFNPKAVGKQQWTICSYGPRIMTFRNHENNNEWDSKEVHPSEELKKLFITYGIDYHSNLLAQILIKDDKSFLETILHLLGLTLQMRNSVSGTARDFIISPVADENGMFYCSDNGDNTLPQNADANGAYNIARKGLWVVKQIQQSDNTATARLAITNEEWMNFAQQKTYKE